MMLMFSRFLTNAAKAMSPVSAVNPQIASPAHTQIRNKYYQVPFNGSKNYWPQWTMMKNQNRRMVMKEYGVYRLRYNAMRKSGLLPPALKEIADYEILTQPENSCFLRLNSRCAVTSKGRGNVSRWRLSRFIFRHLADYNKLAGVQRGFWS